VARFTFFIGKGGVGKTTVSSAYALRRADANPRKRILLLSTDPAHSLADVLQTNVADAARLLPANGRFWVRQIDPDKQIKKFLARERGDILALLNKGSLFTSDELEPLLDTSLPGMAEVAALLAVHELLADKFDEIVIDTAPMGHAIRLFQMPEHFARFLDVLETAASRDNVLARHFGGHVKREPALDRWAHMVAEVEEALSAQGSKLVLVTTPEPFSLNEAARSAMGFSSAGAPNQIAEVVLNRAVRNANECTRCKRRAGETRMALTFVRKHFSTAKLFVGEDPGCPILGIERLRAFGEHIFDVKKLSRSVVTKAPKAAKAKFEPASWPSLLTPLTLTVGKGGVGKTTISAALALHHRQSVRNETVTICSIDPAPSLDDVFEMNIGSQPKPVLRDRKLLAAEYDAMAEFQQWADGLRRRLNEAMSGEERGIHVDVSLDRKFLLALLDVVPPGVDEIFAIFGILDLLRTGGRVVIDMAPTGHALELLRTPARLLAWTRLLLKTLAAHRTLPMAQDAAVEVAKLSQNVRELASILRDEKRSRIVVVTLPEPLPDYETRRLMKDLNGLDAPLGVVFLNRVLIGKRQTCARCRLTEQWQAASIASLRREMRGIEVFVARQFEEMIAGAKGLKRFTNELWRLQDSGGSPMEVKKRQSAEKTPAKKPAR
jgi:arsenite-transporting ATPase